MKDIKLPAFGEDDFSDNLVGAARVCVIRGAAEESFSRYEAYLSERGFSKCEERSTPCHLYAAFRGEGAVYMNYYHELRELYLVLEEDVSYFSFTDKGGEYDLSAQITQLDLEDFGMCYVIRLPDGRFIVIDGGQGFVPDQRRLLACLKRGCPVGAPTIAAWILTHPHSDHFNCFVDFNKNYSSEALIEKVFYNFPAADDLAHYPLLDYADPRYDYDDSATAYIPMMEEQIRLAGASVHTPHTGQVYKIGAATLEILSSMDDTVHVTDNINATSTVIRMELCGQVILWAADAGLAYSRLAEKHGEYLKADILQIPHHGFGCGDADAEIAGYKLIAPSVCLLPVSEADAFTIFCTHRAGARYLMTEADVDEIITGSEGRTVTLPYTPAPRAKEELRRRFLHGLDNCGSTCWIFSDLHTANAEDFNFTLLNTANATVTVWIELFFEDPKRKIRSIKATVAPTSIKRLSIIGEDVDPDALHFNWLSLKAQGIPEDVPFAARFCSGTPIVISHKAHRAAYSAQNR